MVQISVGAWAETRPAASLKSIASPSAVAVRMPILGRTFTASVPVDDAPASLADVVPVAWRLCDEIVRITAGQARLAGKNVPCRKGCSACCRYMVPLSVPEVFRLWQDIQALPQRKRVEVLADFQDAALRIIEAARTRPPVSTDDAATASDEVILSAAGKWYAELALRCPFLAGDVCSFYPTRPVACRKHCVVSDPRYCSEVSSALGERLALPIDPVRALCRLAGEMERTEPQAVLLPLAPMWALDNLHRARRTWPARRLVTRLVEILTEQAGEFSPPAPRDPSRA